LKNIKFRLAGGLHNRAGRRAGGLCSKAAGAGRSLQGPHALKTITLASFRCLSWWPALFCSLLACPLVYTSDVLFSASRRPAFMSSPLSPPFSAACQKLIFLNWEHGPSASLALHLVLS